MIEVKNGRISKDDSTFHFWIICGILTGNNRNFPVIIPKQRDFSMNGNAAVVEAAGNHLKRFRADATDPVIDQQLKREQLIIFDVILKLLYAFIGKGIGRHEQVDRAGLFKQVHD